MVDLVIRTSDRQSFKRCRRRWNWSSHLRQNRDSTNRASYFWLGSGGHFALEDYHGYNYYKHPVEGFRAYVEAYRKMTQHHASRREMPDDWVEQTELGEGILDYYLTWLEGRDPLETLWLDGEPQVEVHCRVPLQIDIPQPLIDLGYDRVVYEATIDRMVVIEDQLWVLDYKFYKQFYPNSLEFDQQMSSYIWIASTVFNRPVAGAIHMEFKKVLPNEPRILGSGKLSTAAQQGTTHRLYRQTLINMYGEVDKAPKGNIDCLNDLALKETEHRDDFIKRTFTYRTPEQIQAEGTKIMMETEDMINPELSIYPNSTKDCTWDCDFRDICLMLDRDDDWENALFDTTVDRAEEKEEWRTHLQ